MFLSAPSGIPEHKAVLHSPHATRRFTVRRPCICREDDPWHSVKYFCALGRPACVIIVVKVFYLCAPGATMSLMTVGLTWLRWRRKGRGRGQVEGG